MIKKRINLLPPGEQKQNHFLEINFQVIRFGFTVAATVLVLGSSLFVANLFLQNSLGRTEAEIESHSQILASYKRAGLEDEILELNETMTNFNTLVKSPTRWSPYLVELAQLLPEEISIDTLVIDAETRKVEATGQAETRNSLLRLREKILLSPYFENINFPLANIESPVDVSWKFRFYMKTDAP